MKTFFLLIFSFILFTSLVTQAQDDNFRGQTSGYMLSDSDHGIVDTTVNDTVKYQYVSLSKHQDIVTIQTVVTKISGTPGGIVTLEGSLNGTRFDPLVGTDTLTITNVAEQSHYWVIKPSTHTKYRLKYAPSGTQSTKFTTNWITRKDE